jgi:hypothetical protein
MRRKITFSARRGDIEQAATHLAYESPILYSSALQALECAHANVQSEVYRDVFTVNQQVIFDALWESTQAGSRTTTVELKDDDEDVFYRFEDTVVTIPLHPTRYEEAAKELASKTHMTLEESMKALVYFYWDEFQESRITTRFDTRPDETLFNDDQHDVVLALSKAITPTESAALEAKTDVHVKTHPRAMIAR